MVIVRKGWGVGPERSRSDAEPNQTDDGDVNLMRAFTAALQKAKVPPMAFDAATVEMFLSSLTDREREIFSLRNGLGSSAPMTAVKVGAIVGLSGGRIGQIEAKIIRTLAFIARSSNAQNPIWLHQHFTRRLAEILRMRDERARLAADKERIAEEKRAARLASRERSKATARRNAWRRQVLDADRKHQTATAQITVAQRQIASLEARSWLGSLLRPTGRPLARHRAELADAMTRAGEAASRKASLLAEPPDADAFSGGFTGSATL